jgi:hypothetical protein
MKAATDQKLRNMWHTFMSGISDVTNNYEDLLNHDELLSAWSRYRITSLQMRGAHEDTKVQLRLELFVGSESDSRSDAVVAN